jgi:IclR family transcriptional regulator, pca regulon regulatory protein
MTGASVANDYPERGDRSARRQRPADPKYSNSAEHGVALLGCFTGDRPVLGIAELADMLELSRSTIHRYASTLVAIGYIEQDKKRRYRLSNAALGPGMSVIETLRAETPAARTILEDLRNQTGHTVSMAALESSNVIYLHRLHAHGAHQYQADLGLRVGAHVPIHSTAIGKALLASLSEPEQQELLARLTLKREGPNTITGERALAEQLTHIRANRVATCDEEQAAGVRSIAAVITQPGRPRPLAISVTVPAQRHTLKSMTALFDAHIRAAVKRI